MADESTQIELNPSTQAPQGEEAKDSKTKKKKRQRVPAPFKTLPSDDQQENQEKSKFKVAVLPPMKTPVVVGERLRGWTAWESLEYNLTEIIRVAEVESLVTQAFSKKEKLMFKEGYEFIGKNPQTVNYIRTRLAEIALVSGIPTDSLIRSMGTSLIKVSNFFGAERRSTRSSTGRRRTYYTARGEITLDPIAAIYPIAPESVEIKRSTESGEVIAIRQVYNTIKGINREFDKNHYIHFKTNARDGLCIGVPDLVPVLDDIRALRRLEENVEIMLYQYLSPLYKYRIGNKDIPQIGTYSDGRTEIDIAEERWRALPSEGAMIMPWHHDIEVVGARNHALDPIPFLNYYIERVLFGLGVSLVDIGKADTSNRATADNLSRILIDGVKHLQRELSRQFKSSIIEPLLLESTFPEDFVLDPENTVELVFKEIDVDAQIKRENHAINLFSGHGVTQGELRAKLGFDIFSEEEFEDTYFKKIQEVLELLKAKNQPGSAEGEALARSPSSAIESGDLKKEENRSKEQAERQAKVKAQMGPTAGQRAAQAVTTPSNQYGKKLGPEKAKSSFTYFWTDFREKTKDYYHLSPKETKDLAALYLLAGVSLHKQQLASAYIQGIESSGTSLVAGNFPSPALLGDLYQVTSSSLETLLDTIQLRLETSDRSFYDVLDAFSYQINLLENLGLEQAYFYGRVVGYHSLGIESFIITTSISSQESSRQDFQTSSYSEALQLVCSVRMRMPGDLYQIIDITPAEEK